MHKACASVAYAAQYERQQRDRQAEILTDLLASDVDGQLVRRVERITEVQQERRRADAAEIAGLDAARLPTSPRQATHCPVFPPPFAAKTLPLPCVFPPPSRLRHCLRLAYFSRLRGYDTAFAVLPSG